MGENLLIICGQRDTRKEGYNFSSKFSQSFYLDPTIKFDKINAALDNGVLTISAPKELTKVEKKIRKLPITVVNSGNAVKKEEKKSEGEKKINEAGDETESHTIDLDEDQNN